MRPPAPHPETPEGRRAAAAIDPRPDLQQDTELWGRLLGLAAPIDAPDPHGLTGLVRFVRCEGGRLEVAETQGGATLRLLPPREWFREDLAALVQGAGHVGLLVRLLSLAAEGLAPTGPATAPVGLSALAAV